MNTKINKDYLFFIVFALTISFLLYLSFNGYWSLTHGPLYFFIGDYLANFGKLGSTLFIENELNNDGSGSIRTFQLGIAFIHAVSIFLLGKYWYIFFILLVSLIWTITTSKLIKFLCKIEFKKIDACIISLLIFFQPYNLNQLANFSNESVYFPLLIYYFIFVLNLGEINLNTFIKKNKFKFIFFLIFLFFGSFFRLHHFIFFGSFILYFLLKKKYIHFLFFLFFLFLTLICKIIFIKYTAFSGSLNVISAFLTEIYMNIVNGQNDLHTTFGYEKLNTESANAISDLEKSILYSVSNLSFYLFVNKFIGNFYIALIISIIFGLIPIISLVQNFKNKIRNFSFFSMIFIFFSCLFVFILPIFENSYHLPVTFLIIIFNYFIIKKYLKSYFYKFFVTIVAVFIIFLSTVFGGIIKFKNIEIYAYRDYVQKVKKFKEKINEKETLVYFNEKIPSMPEIYRWYLKFPICNYNMMPEECKKIRDIRDINNIYVIKTDIDANKGPKINAQLIFKNYNIVEDNDDFFFLNEK